MTACLTSARVEIRRLTRSGLLIGLLAAFAFFGLSGPALALSMPEILGSAANTDQLTIHAAPATPDDGITLFNQSAMQLGLILAVAVAVTSMAWDARTGSSIYYRTRVAHLSTVTIPRLAVTWIAAIVAYALGLLLAVVMTNLTIGRISSDMVVGVWAGSTIYLVMTMAIGFLVMSLARRTAPAIAVAVATILALVLPLLSQFPALSAWTPTMLLTGSTDGVQHLGLPILSALIVTALCVVGATLITANHSLRRDA